MNTLWKGNMNSLSEKEPSASAGMSFSGFTFQKKASQSKVKLKAGVGLGGETSRDSQGDVGKDFVLSLEGKTIHSTKPKPKAKDYIVPFIGKNRWRLPGGDRTALSSEDGRQGRSEEELQLDREAAEAVLRDLQEAQIRASGADESGEGLVVPLLLQNKPPTVEGREEDELADVELRPEQSSMDDYEAMPIEKFGEAVLKGMGWKKGEAIGRTNKGLIEPIEFIPRIGGLGLGATPRAPPPEKKDRIKKPGEEPKKKVLGPYIDKDGRVRHVKKIGEEIPQQPLRGFVAGNYARVLSGPHKGLKGKIISVDDDTARVVLRMAINSQQMSFSQHHLEWLSKEMYVDGGRGSGRSSQTHTLPPAVQSEKSEKKYGLITKEDRLQEKQAKNEKRNMHRTKDNDLQVSMPSSKRLKHSEDVSSEATDRKIHRTQDGSLDRYKSKKREDDRRIRSDLQRDPTNSDRRSSGKKRSKDRKIDEQSYDEEITRETNWLSSNLRARIVDQDYKKGKFYNTKVVVVDVVSLGTCVCQTDSGKLLEGVTQSMLETVVPRTLNAPVMLVGGKRQGQLARLIEQERSKAKAVVELILSKEVLSVHFDDICEYVGDVEDMDM